MKRFLLIAGIILWTSFLTAQVQKDTINVLRSRVINGDTVLVSSIPEVNIYPALEFKNRWEYWRYRRLIRNVKAAYPYAKIAGDILKDVDSRLAEMRTDRQRKKYVNSVEDEIRDQFEDEVKHLTISQGRILIKLIDRETGNTTYDVLKDIKGGFSAVFWQAIARVFGSTLKSEYDPDGEDYLIEHIILMIESGQL
ncbi:MAG: DUF4294 domain-containing protein [Bacteroidales bacterium]